MGELRLYDQKWSATISSLSSLQKHVLNQTLVDSHLEGIPSLGSLTARCLAGRNLQNLGGEANGALDAKVLGLSTVDEFGADLLERLDVARGQGDADLVDFL